MENKAREHCLRSTKRPGLDTVAIIAGLLGREPRGLEEVTVVDANDQPMVIRVCSLVEGKPFPNLFWLVDAALVYKIDGDEARGLIRELQYQVDNTPKLQRGMIEDHNLFIALRNDYMTASVKQQLQGRNFYEVLQRRGIGGIEDFGRIRCLHTWYASHLVVPNTIGCLVDRYWEAIDKTNVVN